MATQQRNIREKLFIFKRITHDIVVEIFQTCSDIAKTDAKTQMLKLTIYQKNNFKKLEDSKPRIIETIEKIYDYSHDTQGKYKRQMMLDSFR